MGSIKITSRPHYNVTLKYDRSVRVVNFSGESSWVTKETFDAFGDTPMGVFLAAIKEAKIRHPNANVKAATNVTQIPDYPALIILDIKP